MTVPSTARRAGPYTGNGVTTTFSFSFKTFAAGDLVVTRTASTGVETTLVLNSDYSVSLNVDQDASPGGTITYPISGSPLPAGHKLTIVGDLAYEQTTDLLGGGAFNARVIEDTFDRTVIQIQQLEERLDRAAVLPVSVSGVSVTLPDPEASKVLGWNVTETGLVNIDASSLASVTASAYVVVDKFTGDGSTTQFVCSQLPGSTNAAEVTIAGVMQNPAVDYTVSGARVVFTSPPPNGAVIIVRFLVAASQSSGAAFTTERHIATSGQSVFTLANAYAPGADTISVFINGVLMTSVIDYAETSANVVTFVTGLSLNDEVVFHIWRTTVLSTADAANVSYTPAGSGAVQRTVQSKLRDVVSVKDFGAVGDGVTDDTAAVQAALNSDQPLDWGGLTYRITSTVSRTATKDVFWQGRNATIVYAGTHAERAVLLLGGGIEYVLNDITVDGAKLVNKCLEIDNNTDNYSNLTCNNVFVTRAKRLNTFNGGEGLLVRGSFNSVAFNGGGASDCELPAGQGTSGSIGISGISVTWYSTTRYVRAMYVNGAKIEKIYSSDLSYQDDQDGIKFFSPTDGTRKVPSNFSCTASEFVNCYGRSIKTQCRDTVVQACSFIRTEGLTSGRGNGEIDAQNGNGTFRDNSFSYTNGQEPLVCVNVSGSLGTPGMIADGNSVVLDTSTTLSIFAQVFPSTGLFSRHAITNNKIFGKVKEFFSFNANGNKNYADVSNNYIGEMVDGATSQKALVYVRSSGGTSPYFANITATGNFYDNTHAPALVRDGISGSSMFSALSAWSNFGFTTNNVAVNPAALGLKTNAIANVDKIGPAGANAYVRVIDLAIPGSGTLVVDVGNIQGALLLAQMQFTSTSACIFSSDSANSTNTVIHAGAQWGVGNTTDPGSGTFRVWQSGTRQLTFRNTNGSDRSGVLMILSPGT